MTRRRTRILFLVQAFEPDAPTRLLAGVAAGARQTGRFECLFVALSRRGAFESEARASGLETGFVGMRSWADAAAVGRLTALIRDFGPDILHATLLRPSLFGAIAGRLARVPQIVVTQNGIHEWDEGGAAAAFVMPDAFRLAAGEADVVVAVSDATRRDLIATDLSPENLIVIPNGVDTTTFHPRQAGNRERILGSLGFEPDAFVVGAAGNLRMVKGHAVLVRAATDLTRRFPAMRFVIWGDGPERAMLESLVTGARLDDRVILPGWSPDLPSSLAALDLFVQPSLSESFGMAAAEAMACGVPVIASDVGGLPEVVGDGEGGLLFPQGDECALAFSVAYLAERDAERETLARGARARAVKMLGANRMVAEYIRLYDSRCHSNFQT